MYTFVYIKDMLSYRYTTTFINSIYHQMSVVYPLPSNNPPFHSLKQTKLNKVVRNYVVCTI